MLAQSEIRRVDASIGKGIILSIFHRTGPVNLPFSRRVDHGKVIATTIDSVILEKEGGYNQTIRKEDIIIIA